MDVVHHHRLVEFRVEVHTTHRKCTDRLTVISARQAHKALLFRLAALLIKLKTHLQSTLHRGRTIVVEMEFPDFRRRDPVKLLSQRNGRFMTEICEDDMLQLVELFLDGRIDVGIAVSKKIRPPGADDIKIFVAVHVVEPDSLAVVNDDRRQCLIILHLRAWMPDEV